MINGLIYFDIGMVAPYAGAWIEIVDDAPERRKADVAPYAGARIEIYS
mgnify:CR=1 FL=1